MFADEQGQALTIGLWIVGAFVILQVVNTILSTIVGWRKLTVVPPLADQFVSHAEIQALEARITQKLTEQDSRLTVYQDQTRERLHKLADEVNAVKLLQAALPGVLRKDFAELLRPIAEKLEARDPALAAMGAKIDILMGALLPPKLKES